LLATGLAVVAGCTPFRPQPPVTAPEVKPWSPETTRPAPVKRSTKPLPIPARPLMVSTDCSYRDDIGTEGRLVLDVHDSTVRRFASAVNMGRRGSCRFDLSAFRQTAFTPTPTLVAGACTVSMWEQGDEVTVSYRNCASQCSPGAHEYLWPTLVSRRTGVCR
jgi:hypothetical protein